MKNVIITPSLKYTMNNINKSDDDWKSILTDEQYQVCRQKGTEPPFTGKYTYCKDDGIYRCVCCGNELFGSDTKFDSGTGWPSFYKPIHENSIKYETDSSYGMLRTEVMCAKCGAHLGHVFDDGPAPTFSRFCINSVSLDLDRKTSPKNSL